MDTKPSEQAVPRLEPWAAHAEQWSRVGPPLRPCLEDLHRLQAAWVNSLPQGLPTRPIEILLLGVTPEIAIFPWASDFNLTAVDASAMMIQAVWPGNAPGRRAVLGDWLSLPFGAAAFDLILCDCGLVVIADMDLFTPLSRELQRVLRPDGRVVLRHFSRPDNPESVADLTLAVAAGGVGNFNELKLRLLMALQGDRADLGVSLSETFDCFERLFPDREALAARLGCSLAIISTIDAYRGRNARYAFPTVAEVADAFETFSLLLGPAGQYELADRCPVFSLTPKP